MKTKVLQVANGITITTTYMNILKHNLLQSSYSKLKPNQTQVYYY